MSGDERPADAARRALRAARGRGSGDGDSGAVSSVNSVGPRPGDEARAALREAVQARRAGEPRTPPEPGPGPGPDGENTEGGPVDAVAESHADEPSAEQVPAEQAPTERASATKTAATKTPAEKAPAAKALKKKAESKPSSPADAAREALRSARRAADPPEEDSGTGTGTGTCTATGTGTGTRPGSAPRAVEEAGGGSRNRARDVRELIAEVARGAQPDAMEPKGAAVQPDPDEEPSPDDGRPPRTGSPYPTGAQPHTPRTMASPHRDGDHRRTFPAFPALPADADADADADDNGGGLAATWWGHAWVRALEEGALDPARLARGRGYAERGNVDAITVTPGLVLAYVRGSRPRPYRVQVRLRTLEDPDWERFLDAAAERPGHIAALLDKEMPQALAEGEVRLLPGPGELDPQCSCPDRAHPCKHAAALCYQTARLLDADPFVLLLLRGRGERELLDALSRRSAARAARAAQERAPADQPGVRAGDAFARRVRPPLPPPLPVPPHPGHPPAYPAAPGGPDPFALDQLATDAAARAHALLSTGRDPVAELTLWQDAVRLAAARPGSGLTAGTRALYASLASAAGRTVSELARAVAAWRQGGYEGLAVLEEPWDPPAGRFDRARPLLLAADLPAFRPRRNRLTHPSGHVQLRLGRDGLWYAYESEPGAEDWWPRGTPDLDPVGALTGLGTRQDPD
ncbi:SWIM zinc finger family protein [Streptomyces sp. NPDC091377]|uniref:SWIM zinc finger family protein n=1 Tax=Streptomyces sp. NPDC091377 TaxID=3365995 RepID=UPI0037F4369A